MATDLGIEDNVDAIIVVGDRTVETRDFGTPMILAAHNVFAGRVQEYATLAEVVDAGFAAGSTVHTLASGMLAGDFKPRTIKVGRRGFDAANGYDVTVADSVVDGNIYTVTVKLGTNLPVSVSVTANTTTLDTPTEIAAELATQLEADAVIGGLITASSVGAVLTVVSDTGATALSVGVNSTGLTIVTSQNETIETALTAITGEDNSFFFLASDERTKAIQEDLADWANANKRIYVGSSQDADIWDGAETDDIASRLEAKSYNQSLIFAQDNANEAYGEANVIGAWASKVPGAGTLNGATLIGSTPTQMSRTQINVAKGKNANVYVTRGGLPVFEDGVMSSGRRAADARGILFLEARLEERLFNYRKAIVDSGSRIPYTDPGVEGIVGEMTAVLQEAVDIGLITSFRITPPLVADADPADKAAGIIRIPFTGVLAGEISQIVIRGFLSI